MRTPLVILLLAFVVACGASLVPTPTPRPTRTPSPSPTPLPRDTGWEGLAAGLEARRLLVTTARGTERVHVVRVDPALHTLRVRYAPGVARTVREWAGATGALLTLNAGYFTEEHLVTALTVSEGVSHGTPLGAYAGMLAVPFDGPPQVRWLQERPYDPAEPLRAAVQSFPVLVKPGGVMGFPPDGDDGRPARRTVVAQDREGRLLFIVAEDGNFSLHELAVWLASSDLGIDVALNLDGGTSSGLWLREGPVRVDSHVGVPAAITVDPRS
jgi:hypothetical protein